MAVSIEDLRGKDKPSEVEGIMSMKDFMNKCTACGGNWGAMLLTGIKRVFPDNYEEVEKEYNSMGFLMVVFIHLCFYASGELHMVSIVKTRAKLKIIFYGWRFLLC